MYYWYFGSLALYQVGGECWKTWSRALATAVVGNQRMDGGYCDFKGSWDPIDPWGPDGGRVYSTALMAMCCECYYRPYDNGAFARIPVPPEWCGTNPVPLGR